MRNILFFVFLLLITLALLVFAQPQWVPEPAKDGAGPLAIKIDPRLVAPEYHSPIEWWRTHHMDLINNGDLVEADCLQCHDVATSCNNCHSYVGVRAIPTPTP
jgi:hypothetical protein